MKQSKTSEEHKTATEVAADIQAKSATKVLLKEFHKEWKKHGEPHPNSNAYLALNRAFFYTKGLEKGIGHRMMFEDLDTLNRMEEKGDIC